MKVLFFIRLALAGFLSSAAMASGEKPEACQFYVDDYSEAITRYGDLTKTEAIRVNLVVEGSPSEVEMYVKFREISKYREMYWKGYFNIFPTESIKEVTIPAVRQKDGRYLILFKTEETSKVVLLNTIQMPYIRETSNQILDFSFKAKFDNESILRLRNGDQDFTRWNTIADKDHQYPYSRSEALNPQDPIVTNVSYLWRDSGSPIFKSRVECLEGHN
ncbi:MAG: hypothetical protein J0L82_05520 [Deltaproteobacteria bacterium]|nr:hypothetical protein [Deltaproteobacteria bacterium]